MYWHSWLFFVFFVPFVVRAVVAFVVQMLLTVTTHFTDGGGVSQGREGRNEQRETASRLSLSWGGQKYWDTGDLRHR